MIGKNNPLNVRYNPLNHWKGQIGNTKGFCDFSDQYFGVRAAMYLIFRSYKKKSFVTYYQIINRYAPSSENNTAAYVDFICSHMKVFPFDIPYHMKEWINLFWYMSKYEGNPLSKDTVEQYFLEFLGEGK